MGRIIVFPPGCSRCGSSRLAFLEYMSRSHRTEDWFQCDVCGHFLTVPHPPTIPPRRTRKAFYTLAAVAGGTLTALALRAASRARPQTSDFARSLIEAAHERRRVAHAR
jgi:hypothetical protein